MYDEVKAFIDENILQSKVWDMSTEVYQRKAVNTAIRSLHRLLPRIYPADEEIPVEHVAEQVVWLMKIDDTFQRAELGAKSITIDGISISFTDKDRSIAPFILEENGISPDALTGGLTRRKVGRYGTYMSDSYRRGC